MPELKFTDSEVSQWIHAYQDNVRALLCEDWFTLKAQVAALTTQTRVQKGAMENLTDSITQLSSICDERRRGIDAQQTLIDNLAVQRNEAMQALLLLWDGIHLDKDAWSLKFSRSNCWEKIEAALLDARNITAASADVPVPDPMPATALIDFGCQPIHWNENWNGGWWSYRYPIEFDKDGDPWLYLEVRFDKDKRYDRDYMVYLMTESYAIGLKQIVTLTQFKTLAGLLAKKP